MLGISNILQGIKRFLMKSDNENLSGAGDLYLVRDLRTRARKEPGATVANKNLNFVKIKDAKIENFNKELYENKDVFEYERDYKEYKFIRFQQKDEKSLISFAFYLPTKKLKGLNFTDNSLGGNWRNSDIEIDTKKAVNIQISPYSNSNKPTLQRIESDAKKTKEYNYYYFEKYNAKDYYCWISTTYYKQLRQKAFDKFYSDYINREERYYTNYQKKLLKSFYENPKKFDCYIIGYNNDPQKISDEYRDSFVGLLNNQTLSGYLDVYYVKDLRKKSRKEPEEIKSLKNFNFSLYHKATEFEKSNLKNNSDFQELIIKKDGDKYLAKITFFLPQKKKDNGFEGYETDDFVYFDLDKVKDFSESSKDYYRAYISKKYYEELQRKAIYKRIKIAIEKKKEYEKLLKKYTKSNYSYGIESVKKDIERLSNLINYLVEYYNINNTNTLGKPQIKFEFETNEELQKFLNKNKETLIDSYVDVDEYDFDKKALNGIDDDIFNCSLDKLDCKGLNPTYIRLSNYDSYVDSAEHENTLLGYGFDKATINTLRNTVLDNYKQVARLAPLLKGDSDLQTFFNIWYFLHEQIRYALDEDGKEEIRTPARAWADRKSGIDCDCLAVLTASILINLGYKPRFEIVAMNNSNCYEHIYVVCNDIVIDRVLPNFNERPKNVTKTLIMDIPVYQLSGVKGCALNGINEEILEDDSILKTSSEREKIEDVNKVVINLNDSNNKDWFKMKIGDEDYQWLNNNSKDSSNMPYSSSIVADNEVEYQRKNDNSLGVFAGLAAVGLIVALCSNSKK